MSIKAMSDKIEAAIGTITALGRRSENSPSADSLRDASLQMLEAGLPTLVPLLPLFFSLKGKPYTLENHFPFEPFFNTAVSRKIVLKCARQVSKSTSLAAQGTINSAAIPFFNTLYVTPLYEMIRRFSNNYVKGFIEYSPVKKMLVGSATSSNVLQRSFVNGSSMFFSFAFLDADRTRGLNNDKVGYDEVQDMDESFIPIIRETMSGSMWGLEQFTGTPKTLDNTIEKLWTQSSQAEWVIPCQACHYDNYPCMTHDLDEMIGPFSQFISEARPGTICARCKKPIFPRLGSWHHRFPERVADFAGYHVPQIIMPMHYADVDKWRILLEKKQGLFNTPAHVFYNEVCGESFDSGSKLVTMTQLKTACSLHPNTEEEAEKVVDAYDFRVLSVDWGGGGIDGVSFTVYSVLGIRPDGSIDVIFAYRSLTPHDFALEAQHALNFLHRFRCQFLVHDFNGAGALREQFVIQHGFPLERVIPIWYVAAATQALMRHIPATEIQPRDHYRVDKARSLVLTCEQIKTGRLRFFEYDGGKKSYASLVDDFLALVEEKVDSQRGRDVYKITRQQGMTDDFAQSVNMGCCALWHLTGVWPDVSAASRYQVPVDLLEAISPPHGMSHIDD